MTLEDKVLFKHGSHTFTVADREEFVRAAKRLSQVCTLQRQCEDWLAHGCVMYRINYLEIYTKCLLAMGKTVTTSHDDGIITNEMLYGHDET